MLGTRRYHQIAYDPCVKRQHQHITPLYITINNRCWPIAILMLGNRLRRWTNIKAALRHRVRRENQHNSYIDTLCLRCCGNLETLGFSTSTRRWTNVGLMLAHRLQRWPSIKPTLAESLVFPGSPLISHPSKTTTKVKTINGKFSSSQNNNIAAYYIQISNYLSDKMCDLCIPLKFVSKTQVRLTLLINIGSFFQDYFNGYINNILPLEYCFKLTL